MTDIDPRDAADVLRRMRQNSDNLKRAVRWPGVSNRWSEAEKKAAEHQHDREIAALNLALDLISVLTTEPIG